MNNIIAITLTLLAIVLFLSFNVALAGERVKAYELAESGITIEFSMTAEEITAEDAKDAGLVILRKVDSVQLKKRVIVFELAESGQTTEFQIESADTNMACEDLFTERNC